MQVVLVSMPFGALDRPALGLSLLKVALHRDSVPCELVYALESFARQIGSDNYRWLGDELPYTFFADDWCFTLLLHGRQPNTAWAYVTRILREEWQMPPVADIRLVVAIREQIQHWLETLLAERDWGRYDIGGFTSTFVQNIASLAFARLLKVRYPHLRIVFGGANCEGDMGVALFETYEFVDHVCQGEADESFPALISALDQAKMTLHILGVLSRGCKPVPARPVQAMDQLPYPDLRDYFAMHRRTTLYIPVTLLMETLRGCWWGAKHHCTFCGLYGQVIGFRIKSPDRAIAEFDHILGHYPANVLSIVDNILDMVYSDSVLPALAQRDLQPAIFYEFKANLSRQRVARLKKAGIEVIQPGIESLSGRVLKLMSKGTTGLRNIQLLKWAREYGVGIEWNILYGFPGKTDADYVAMLRMMPALSHLQPPSGFCPIRIDRFNPYVETPETFGISGLSPLPILDYLYPVSPRMRAQDTGATLSLTDTRQGRQVRHVLRVADRIIYLSADRVITPQSIVSRLNVAGYGDLDRDRIVGWLDQLFAAELVSRSGDHYLALAIYDRFPVDWEKSGRRRALAEV